MKHIVLALVAIGVILGILYFFNNKQAIAPVVTDQNFSEKVNVENYLKENISRLSPVPAVLGGTWYVVSSTIDVNKNSGTVEYEDGHISETRNFSYITNANGEVANLVIIDPNNSVACTQEAKLCPDGSAVGRTGPNCEFSICPGVTAANKSGIKGTVTLGPTCPVERIPPDPQCAPRPYATSISIIKSADNRVVKTIQSDAKGTFSVDLAAGAYTLQAQGGSVLPRCIEAKVLVISGQYTTIEISCDTGIR